MGVPLFKATRVAIAAVATIALGALSLIAPVHAEDVSPGVVGEDAGVTGSVGPEMQDCNCWDDFQFLQEEQPDGSPSKQ